MNVGIGLRMACAMLLAVTAATAWGGEAGAQGGAGLPAPPETAPPATADRSIGPGWVALPGERLAALRGGFELPSGLPVSFGIERVAYVNGTLVASASVNIPDVSRMTPQQAQALQGFGRPLVIQLGGGNHFDVSGALGGGAVFQNTLDGQHVQALTTINVGVGTLGLFQELNSLSALQNALLIGGL